MQKSNYYLITIVKRAWANFSEVPRSLQVPSLDACTSPARAVTIRISFVNTKSHIISETSRQIKFVVKRGPPLIVFAVAGRRQRMLPYGVFFICMFASSGLHLSLHRNQNGIASEQKYSIITLMVSGARLIVILTARGSQTFVDTA